jgi:hypothetical protein
VKTGRQQRCLNPLADNVRLGSTAVLKQQPSDVRYSLVVSTGRRNTLSSKDGVYAYGRRYHRGFTAAEKTELWDRWQRGEADLVLFIEKRERLMAQQVERKRLIRCLVIR